MVTIPRTKIVCTIGPATEDDNVLRELIRSGMCVARLNFSHGDHAYHRTGIERVRRIAQELDANVAIMADTRGPEIRTCLNRDHQPVTLETGGTVTLTTRPVESSDGCIAITYDGLPREVGAGSQIFIDDGLIELRVESTTDTEIACTVISGGDVKERKGINVPNVKTSLPRVTDKDRDDIRFACEMGADAIAASFVCDAEAVREVRKICVEAGAPATMVIAKIESALGVTNFDSILEEADGIMVARGDLGVEIPPASTPQVQKKVIAKCNLAYKPVITATQMLDSMISHPRPTRAEVTDVANAIYDGTDCVMLSGETAAGKYPIESVRMMAEICVRAEQTLAERQAYNLPKSITNVSITTCFSAIQMAQRVNAVAILCPTYSGKTARQMCVLRPRQPLLATSSSESTIRHTCFYWGVTGIPTTEQTGLTTICYDALRTVRDAGHVKKDDIVVLVAGDPALSPMVSSMYETDTNVCMIAQVL